MKRRKYHPGTSTEHLFHGYGPMVFKKFQESVCTLLNLSWSTSFMIRDTWQDRLFHIVYTPIVFAHLPCDWIIPLKLLQACLKKSNSLENLPWVQPLDAWYWKSTSEQLLYAESNNGKQTIINYIYKEKYPLKNSLQPKRDICLAVEKTPNQNTCFQLAFSSNEPLIWDAADQCTTIFEMFMLGLCIDQWSFDAKSPQHPPWRTSEHQRRTTSLWNQSCKWRCNRHSWWKFEFYNAMLAKICKFVCIAHKGYGQRVKSRSVVDLAGNSRQLEIFCECKLFASRIFLHLQWLQQRKINN